MKEIQEAISYEIHTDPFAWIDGGMIVKTQPKCDQRARYEKDGPRFLDGSKKNPISVQVCFLVIIYYI